MPRLRKIFQKRTTATVRRSRIIRLSPPMLWILSLSFAGMLIWAFLMGLMVGRGQHPEETLREMAGLEQSGDPAETAEVMAVAETEEPEPQSMQPEPTASEENAPFGRPSGEQTAAWGPAPQPAQAPAAQPASPAPQPQAAPAQRQQAAATPLYDYTFQIAAFKTQKDADSLKARLNEMDIRSRVSKSGSVFLVMVSLRGDSGAPARLEDSLSSLKLGAPLMLSRKLASPGR